MVVGAILAFMSQMDYGEHMNRGIALSLCTFILIFSILGFLMVIALSLGHKNYIMNILVILNYWNKTGFYKDPEKPFHFKVVYRWLYEATIAFFAALTSLFVLLCLNATAPKLSYEHAILFVGVFFAVLAIMKQLYKLKWEKAFKDRDTFIRTLQECKRSVYREDWDQWFSKKKSGFWKEIKDAKTCHSKNSI